MPWSFARARKSLLRRRLAAVGAPGGRVPPRPCWRAGWTAWAACGRRWRSAAQVDRI